MEEDVVDDYRSEQHTVTNTVANSPTPTMTARKQGDVGLYLLAFTMLGGYYGLVTLYMMGDIQENRLGPVKEILNYMTPLIGVMVGYFFGGALSGRRKDDMIASVVVPK